MKNFSKLFGIIAFVAVIAFGLSGCATSYVMSNPFNTGANSNRPIIRMVGTGLVTFDKKQGDNLKVNGVTVSTNQFTLPAAQSYDFKFRVKIHQSAPFAPDIKHLGRANVTYNFVPGKTYYVAIEMTGESKLVSVLIATIAPELKIVIYDTELKLGNKVAEFPAFDLAEKDF